MRATRNSINMGQTKRNAKGLSMGSKNVSLGGKQKESLRDLMALFLSDGV
jgi:pantothenate synthetase